MNIMNDNIYKQAYEYVVKIFKENGKETQIKHLEKTVKWMKKIKPDADEAMLVAAISHDIERAFRENLINDKIKNSDKGFMSEEHLDFHQQKGAEIMGNYLKSIGASDEVTDRVKMLISKHEVGGNDDQNTLKDADSVSFFETNAKNFVKKFVDVVGKDKVKDKFDWMFNRITNDKAKGFAQSMYESVLKMLDEKKAP